MHPLRDRHPGKLHLLTCRIRNAEIWLVPSNALNEIIGGITARYQEMYGVEVFAYTYLGDHYHQLLRAPLENLAQYAENLNKQIALRTNRHYGRTGSFWGRRYDDHITITEVDAHWGYLYVMTNATKHGLVHHPRYWPGLNSWNHAFTGQDRFFPFDHWSKFTKAKRIAAKRGTIARRDDYQTKHRLHISALPQYAHLTWQQQEALLSPALEDKITALREERQQEEKGFLGAKTIKAQEPGIRPKNVSRSSRPKFYTKDPAARKSHSDEERIRRAAYTEASIRFRSGDYGVAFPPYCYRPPLHHKPRTVDPPSQALPRL